MNFNDKLFENMLYNSLLYPARIVYHLKKYLNIYGIGINLIIYFIYIISIANIDRRMHEHSLNCLQKCIKIVEDNIEMSDSASTSSHNKNLTNNLTLANAYYNLAQYTYDSYENQRLKKSEFLEKTLIISVLRGMQYESKECLQMFPLLLQLPNLINNNLKELFNHEVNMFFYYILRTHRLCFHLVTLTSE